MKALCKCGESEVPAKLLLGGREIATGSLKLEADGSEGWFLPDSASLNRHAVSESAYPALVADVGTHQHQIRNVRRLIGGDGRPSLVPGAFGEVVVNQRFYFEVADT
jgi:hypothetical protein